MPRHWAPQKSSVHRAACFALYRALLRQTTRLPLGQLRHDDSQYKIRSRLGNTFRHHAKVQGQNAVVMALRRGYKALVISQDAADEDSNLNRILEQVDRLEARPPKNPSPPQRRRRYGPTSSLEDHLQRSAKTSANHSIFDRPYPTLSGRRTVPRLVNANGIPFLRYQTPQPPALSRVINDRIKAFEHRYDRRYELQNQVQMGKLEDAWDRLLRRHCGLPRVLDPGPSWSEAPALALNEVMAISRRNGERTKGIAMKMYQVMEKERALAEKEKLARKYERHKRYKARRSARREVEENEDSAASMPAAMAG